MTFFSDLATLLAKNFQVEIRTREATLSSLLFVVLVLLIFRFALPDRQSDWIHFLPGIFWIATTFAGTLALSHLSAQEQRSDVELGVVLSGVSPVAHYFSRVGSAFSFLLVLQLASVPLITLFFGEAIAEHFFEWLAVGILGAVGYAGVGTLLSAILGHARLKELLLIVIFYPLLIPLLIAAVEATRSILEGRGVQGLGFMLGYDLIFLAASAVLFEYVIEP